MKGCYFGPLIYNYSQTIKLNYSRQNQNQINVEMYLRPRKSTERSIKQIMKYNFRLTKYRVIKLKKNDPKKLKEKKSSCESKIIYLIGTVNFLKRKMTYFMTSVTRELVHEFSRI
jgi:RNase P/RNase MRP subunit p30